jgi:hypothetical protein
MAAFQVTTEDVLNPLTTGDTIPSGQHANKANFKQAKNSLKE